LLGVDEGDHNGDVPESIRTVLSTDYVVFQHLLGQLRTVDLLPQLLDAQDRVDVAVELLLDPPIKRHGFQSKHHNHSQDDEPVLAYNFEIHFKI
jgi:hypothetical protein